MMSASTLDPVTAKASFWNPPFPERLLFEQEAVVVDLKPHWMFFLKAACAVFVSAFALAWAANWDGSNVLETWGAVVLAAVFVGCLLWLGVRWLKWRSTHFVVTSDRVIFRSGVVVTRGVAVPLERVNNINFHQTLLERIIGAGDLEIESAGADGQQLFYDIRKPEAVQSVIHSQIENNQRRSGPGDVSGTDVATQLERLEGLRDRGTLSLEEFLREKRKILGSD